MPLVLVTKAYSFVWVCHCGQRLRSIEALLEVKVSAVVVTLSYLTSVPYLGYRVLLHNILILLLLTAYHP
jgi:hypothetical protein